MNDSSEKNKILTSIQSKREYIQQWLDISSKFNHAASVTEKTPPNSPLKNDKKFLISPTFPFGSKVALEKTPPTSPKNIKQCLTSPILSCKSRQSRKCITPCTPSTSSALNSKRLASSPIIGGNKRVKRRAKKVQQLDTKNVDDNKCSEIRLNIIEKLQADINSDICTANLIPKKHDEKFLSHTTKTSECSIFSIIECNITNVDTPQSNTKIENNPKVKIKLNQGASQFIESISSEDTSTENIEINVQESNSDTDKTPSDLIEDISSQSIRELCKQKVIPLSQNISNPSSTTSSKSDNNVHISETTVAKTNTQQQCLETFTSLEAIDTASTTESKIDFNKVSYILQCTTDKKKIKRNPKKGSLLEKLLLAVGKERSTVNILRHQLRKKADNVTDKPFILLQIMQHIPVTNDNQLFKCILIEDSANLLSNFLKNNNRFVTVINVPEISCVININQKPVLKVYEPWTILDPNQMLLQIMQFIALPKAETDVNIDNVSNCNRTLKIKHEFNCPCLNNNVVSGECESKFHDSSYNIIKMIFNYN